MESGAARRQAQQAAEAKDFVDLSKQDVDVQQLAAATELPAANDHELDEAVEEVMPGEHDKSPDSEAPMEAPPQEVPREVLE